LSLYAEKTAVSYHFCKINNSNCIDLCHVRSKTDSLFARVSRSAFSFFLSIPCFLCIPWLAKTRLITDLTEDMESSRGRRYFFTTEYTEKEECTEREVKKPDV
jgi:hypothetical protein